jgi:membrane protein YqaA with SNARE-associated domain
MLKRLYDWTLSLAAGPNAELWLAIIAFVESSVFLVPADALFVPMALARPARAMRYAVIATVASTLGGVAGYLIGLYGYEAVARPILEFYGKLEAFEHLKTCAGRETTMIMLVTSGLSHLPPIKVVTILAGVINVGLIFFIVSCLLFRGARFLALAILIRRYGDPIREWIAQRLGLIAALAAGVLVVLYLALRFGLGGGGFPC